MLDLNKIYCGDNLTLIKQLDDSCIDLTVTSPPYDNLRTYNGFTWDFEGLTKELYRVTKVGGVVVWVVGDATINGSETGTSFRQALYFMECGFRLHDTMIWKKPICANAGGINVRYWQSFEYMFILSKGKPKTFNPIKDRINKNGGKIMTGTIRKPDGTIIKNPASGNIISKFGSRINIWDCDNKKSPTHPAPFPEQLIRDHIITWSNPMDIVLDPFMGSGTTAKMALKNERQFIGFEISQEYVDICNARIKQWKEQDRLTERF